MSLQVNLTEIGDQKIKVIKEVRAITGLGLKEAKAAVEEAPTVIKEGVSQEEADEIKEKLEAVGAVVEILGAKRSGNMRQPSNVSLQVNLTEIGDQKIKVIKEVRAITRLGLKEAGS